MGGRVVRAIAGERAQYRPIRSSLTDSSDPVIVARALLGVARFDALYVADLDAILQAGSARHHDVLLALCAVLAHAGVGELWLDAGTANWLDALDATAREYGVRLVRVVGSESLAPDAAARPRVADDDCALSLDYRHGVLLGPAGLDTRAAAWPRRVIVMELAMVGTAQGPALALLERLAQLARRAGRDDLEFYVAGGVRDAADLRRLESYGAAGALVASALHDGRLIIAQT